MILENIFIAILFLLQPVLGQSVIWDENTKSWVSAATATAPAPSTPTPQPQQQQIPQQTTPTTIVQTVPTSAPSATVDLGTLATILTPILGAISAFFLKNRKDMEKKDDEVEQKSKQFVEQVLQKMYPLLQQNTIIASQTAKQEVKIKEISDLLYKVMGEEANKIQGMPEIRQENQIKDMVTADMAAQQYQQHAQQMVGATSTPSMQWDDVKKEWVSK